MRCNADRVERRLLSRYWLFLISEQNFGTPAGGCRSLPLRDYQIKIVLGRRGVPSIPIRYYDPKESLQLLGFVQPTAQFWSH